MVRLTTFFAFLLLIATQANAHMWLRTPLSQGGLNFAGGTAGPCAGRTTGTGQRTTFQAGDKVTFQFRVNQHGPNPFRFALATTEDNFNTVIKEGIPNTVTAGADDFEGVNVEVTIPDTPCDACTIQLSGMGQENGDSTWYNCADVRILAAGTSSLPKPSLVSPASGSTSGGTKVAVTGTNFGTTASPNIKCRFADSTVPGTWVSPTQINCVAPASNNPTTAAVEVSLDGTTFSATGTVYTFTGKAILPKVSKISPKAGPVGTLITVSGSNFLSQSMQCIFNGQIRSEATVESKKKATCSVPFLGEDFITASFEVSVDGSPPSTSGKTFRVSAIVDDGAMSGGAVAGVIVVVLIIVGAIAAVVALTYFGKLTFGPKEVPRKGAV